MTRSVFLHEPTCAPARRHAYALLYSTLHLYAFSAYPNQRVATRMSTYKGNSRISIQF